MLMLKARDRPAIWDRHKVHYVSTRGAAPASGFAEVMLAGLARDGGLYVPDIAPGHWPRLEPKRSPISPAGPMPKSRSR